MKKLVCILLICWLSASYLSARQMPALYRNVDQKAMNHWADSVFDSLSMDERIGQLFMIVADVKTSAQNVQKLKRYVREQKIGGVLFHKGNPADQAFLTNQMQAEARVPLFVSLDGEWGLSMRLSGKSRTCALSGEPAILIEKESGLICSWQRKHRTVLHMS